MQGVLHRVVETGHKHAPFTLKEQEPATGQVDPGPPLWTRTGSYGQAGKRGESVVLVRRTTNPPGSVHQ